MAATAWTLSAHGKIAVLTFERPPRHTMTLAAMTELADHLDRLAEQGDRYSLIMLTGGKDGYFVAHADFDDMAAYADGKTPPGDPMAWRRAHERLENMPQPTLAAVDGQAWGGGCETALACTMRVASERAHFCLPEVSVGIIPGAGGSQRLPRLVGAAKGAELCLSGRRVFAEEAQAIGLVNKVLPTDGFLAAALKWAEKITRHPSPALFAAKQAMVEGLRGPLADGLQLERQLMQELNASEEAKALNATIERAD